MIADFLDLPNYADMVQDYAKNGDTLELNLTKTNKVIFMMHFCSVQAKVVQSHLSLPRVDLCRRLHKRRPKRSKYFTLQKLTQLRPKAHKVSEINNFRQNPTTFVSYWVLPSKADKK